MLSEQLDLVCITEAWVNESMFGDNLQEFELTGYNMHAYQREARIGGGILLYVRQVMKCHSIEDGVHSAGVESLWLDIILKNGTKFRIGAFYRPPDQNENTDRLMQEEISRRVQERTILLGDFNIAGLGNKTIGVSKSERCFMACFEDNFFFQMIHEPTRENKILDLVLTNEENFVQNVNVGETFGNSDHNIIRFSLYVGRVATNRALIPNFTKGNYSEFRSFLSEINWEVILNGLDAYEMWTMIKDKLFQGQDRFIPSRQIRSNRVKHPSWLTREVKQLLDSKKQAFKKLKDTNSGLNLESYRIARNKVRRCVRASKRLAEINFARECSAGNAKRFFSFYKFKAKKCSVGPLEVDGEIVVDDCDIVESLSKQFSSVFTKDNSGTIGTSVGHAMAGDMLEDLTITTEAVEKQLQNIKPNKASGPDEIYARILVECAKALATPLGIIFRRSMEYSEVPEDWRNASVVPIFKKGNRKSVGNYRPVSLTSLVCKVLEKLVKQNVQIHLDRHNLLRDTQHGFRSQRSCLTNLLEFIEYVTKEVDNESRMDVVYLDFSKAFDKVPHGRLIHQLQQHGIVGKVLHWIEAWLQGRKQRVVLNGCKSGWKDVLSGVPQGSVLGPLLFIIFVNNIEVGLRNRVFKFADDIKLVGVANSRDQSSNIQLDLDDLKEWADQWQMTFNYDKCKVMHIGSAGETFSYKMGGRELDVIEEERDLGVLVSKDLKAEKQCISARNRALRMLGLINRSVKYKSREVMKKLYLAYVRPHLEYSVQAWSPYLEKDIDMLERVQRKATRLVSGLSNLEYGERLNALDMYSLKYRRLRGDMIEMYKIVRGLDQVNLNDALQFRVSHRGHQFRLDKMRCRTVKRQQVFSQRVVDQWNRLPADAVGSPSLNVFKSRVDNFFRQENVVFEF